MDIEMIIEEIAMDGEVALACSRSTAYRTKNAVNHILERDNYEWRVTLVTDKTKRLPYSLVVVPLKRRATVGDLINRLKELPEDAEIMMICHESDGHHIDYEYATKEDIRYLGLDEYGVLNITVD